MSSMKITEEYINLLVNKEYFFENLSKLTCPIDNSLLIDPLMCSSCKTSFCKDCINSYFIEHNTCPNNA